VALLPPNRQELRYPSLVSITHFTEDQSWNCSKKGNEEDPEATKRWTVVQGKTGDLEVTAITVCYDREVNDLVFFYKAMHGYINLDVNNFVSFVTHGRTRLSETRTLNCSVLQNKHLPRIVPQPHSQALEQYYGHFQFSKLFQLIDV
jgi:hypothetical protein